MSYQSEAQLEEQMIRQLVGQGFERTYVSDRDGLFSNLKTQLEKFNDKTFTTKEFDKILNHLYKGGVYQKALTLRDRFQLELEDGTSFYVRFFDQDSASNNIWQVTILLQVLILGPIRLLYWFLKLKITAIKKLLPIIFVPQKE